MRLVRFIKGWQAHGYTLAEIKQLLELRENKISNAAEIRALTKEKIESLENRIVQLARMRDELKEILENCPCGAASEPLCPTIR